MSYIALARKYRPQTFDELIGQEFVSISLKNAIALQRVSHAYLFTGARGVGKTSAARILAKALNCLSPRDSNPCNECEHCLEITNGTSMDVVEIDAASNRGIDEIRQLREAVKFLPIKSRYKVYIIDEFHMLTDQAFNALLKTLEEPPSYVVFIFATTDVHKILKTILSRCQRYDFKKIPFEEMFNGLQNIFKKENIHYDTNALNLIVRQSEGCMRDALSLSDQVISYTEGNVSYDAVAQMMGIGQDHLIAELFAAILREDQAPLEGLIQQLENAGISYMYAAEKLVEHTRNLLFVSKGSSHVRKSLTTEEQQFYDGLNTSEHRLFALFQLFQKLCNDLKYSSFERYNFEFGVYKAVSLSQVIPLPVPESIGVPKMAPVRTGAQALASPVKPSAAAAVNNVQPRNASSMLEAAEPTKVKSAAQPDLKQAFTSLENRWHALLQELMRESSNTAAALHHAALVRYDADKVVVHFPADNSFNYTMASREDSRKIFENFIKRKLGGDVAVEITIGGEKKNTLIEKKTKLENIYDEKIRLEAAQNPVVQEIFELFDTKAEDIIIIKNSRGND